MSSAKGQTTSLEFLMVSGVVIAIIVLSFMMYQLNASRAIQSNDRITMEMIAMDVMDSFVKTSGVPGNWEDSPSSTTTFGLASSPHTLDWRKVNAFRSFNYDSARNITGLSNFNYLFSIKTLNRTTLVQSGSVPNNPRMITNPRSVAVMNGTVVYVDFLLWR